MKLSEIEWHLEKLIGASVLSPSVQKALVEASRMVSVIRARTEDKESSVALTDLDQMFEKAAEIKDDQPQAIESVSFGYAEQVLNAPLGLGTKRRPDDFQSVKVYGVCFATDATGEKIERIEDNQDPQMFSVFAICKDGESEVIGDFHYCDQATDYAQAVAEKYGFENFGWVNAPVVHDRQKG